MTVLAVEAVRPAALPLAFAAALGALGVYFLLPRPKGRQVALGTFLALASFGILTSIIVTAFGKPSFERIESILFWLFSGGAVLFGTVLVTQRNPARGAIAFAFVIVSVCGLFLLLAAPFLMAATIVVYAGAIIVTFLFVLMLSHADGPSNENDRSREPLLGSFAGFAFLGLILFGILRTGEPTAPLTGDEKTTLAALVTKLDAVPTVGKTLAEIVRASDDVRLDLEMATVRIESRYRVGETAIPPPLDSMVTRIHSLREAIKRLENSITQPGTDATTAFDEVRGETRLLLGAAELPARNVGTIGMLLYSEHLLAVEMAGTLLLVAAIGAVAIASRKGVPT